MLVDQPSSALIPDSAGSTIAVLPLARRTFAIISHTDAGKTTLTEKLLHEGGAIREEGEVFSKGNRRGARSDWKAIEQQRGITVTSSVITSARKSVAEGKRVVVLCDCGGRRTLKKNHKENK